jgi:hypothetical protein
MYDVLDALGIDLDSLEWQNLSLCNGSDTELFYDQYESNSNIAQVVDEMCLSCPVRKQCLQTGVENGEWGVWGGVFLVSGKVDQNRNSHKTQEVWASIREILE